MESNESLKKTRIYIPELEETFQMKGFGDLREVRMIKGRTITRGRRSQRICSCQGFDSCCCAEVALEGGLGSEHNGGICCCGLEKLADPPEIEPVGVANLAQPEVFGSAAYF